MTNNQSPQPWEEWLWGKAVDQCLLEDDVTEIITRFNQELLTTKLELLERVEKEVIGEDEDPTKLNGHDYYGASPYEVQNIAVKNKLRATQRAKLTTMKEEGAK